MPTLPQLPPEPEPTDPNRGIEQGQPDAKTDVSLYARERSREILKRSWETARLDASILAEKRRKTKSSDPSYQEILRKELDMIRFMKKINDTLQLIDSKPSAA